MPLLETINKIEGRSNNARREIICQYLDSMGIKFERHRYDNGENIIVPSDEPIEIGIGSHYDTVPRSPGANDNGSAIAVALGLVRRFQEMPTGNVGLRYFFFDEEEPGLLGSRAYVADKGIDRLIGVYNMELVGSGDQIALWDVDKIQKTRLLLTLEEQARYQEIPTHRVAKVVTNNADHQSFRNAGIEAFTITTITKKDIELLSEYEKALAHKAPIKKLRDILQRAPIFQHYHQPTDRVENLSEGTLNMVLNLLYESIHVIDKKRSM